MQQESIFVFRMINVINCSKLLCVNFYKEGAKMIKIDGNRTAYDLVNEFPELKPILVDLGFKPLNDDKMLNTVGRMMTLNRGAKQIGLTREDLQKGLKDKGYELLD